MQDRVEKERQWERAHNAQQQETHPGAHNPYSGMDEGYAEFCELPDVLQGGPSDDPDPQGRGGGGGGVGGDGPPQLSTL